MTAELIDLAERRRTRQPARETQAEVDAIRAELVVRTAESLVFARRVHGNQRRVLYALAKEQPQDAEQYATETIRLSLQEERRAISADWAPDPAGARRPHHRPDLLAPLAGGHRNRPRSLARHGRRPRRRALGWLGRHRAGPVTPRRWDPLRVVVWGVIYASMALTAALLVLLAVLVGKWLGGTL